MGTLRLDMATGKISFGKWLLQARKDADLTQQQLSDCVGLKDKSYIGLLENETPHPKTNLPRIPSVEVIKALAECVNKEPLDAFKVLLDKDVVDVTSSRKGRDGSVERLIGIYKKLAGGKRQQLIEFAEFLSKEEVAASPQSAQDGLQESGPGQPSPATVNLNPVQISESDDNSPRAKPPVTDSPKPPERQYRRGAMGGLGTKNVREIKSDLDEADEVATKPKRKGSARKP